MAELYDRRVITDLGVPGTDGVRLEGLRTVFDVTKTDKEWTNTAKISIFNASADTAAQALQRDATVQLRAGYGDTLELLFLGAITRAEVKRERVERILEIESGDAQKARARSVAASLKGQVKVKDALGRVGEIMGLAGVDVDAISDQVMETGRGLTLQGSAARVLNRLTRLNRLDWTIEDDVLVVVPRGQPTREPAVLLSPETGLVGSPAPQDKGRLKITSLLNGQLRLRRIVELRSRDHQGYYLVRKVRHQGDSWSGEYTTTVECTEIRDGR